MKRIWLWIKNHKKTSIFAAVVLVFILSMVFRGPKQPTYETIQAQKQNVVQDVSVTGTVVPSSAVDLAFERTGRVYRTYVKVGDHVAAGQLLAQVSSGDLSAQLRQSTASAQGATALLGQYQSAVAREQARLDEMRHGSTALEIASAQTRVTNANLALDDAQHNLANLQSKATTDLAAVYDNMATVLDDAYTKADDAVNRTTEPMFDNDTTSNPHLMFLTSDLSSASLAETQRYSAGQAVAQMHTLLTTLPQDATARMLAFQQARAQLATVQNFLSTMSTVVNTALGLPQTTLDTYRADIATARTNANTASSNIMKQVQLVDTTKANNTTAITNAQTAVTNAEAALAVAKNDFANVLAGPRPEQITAQEQAVAQATASLKAQLANVQAAWANVAQAQSLLGQAVITAPFAGVVTRQDAKVGQVANGLTPVISLMADTPFEIEAYVPEVDVAKVSLKDAASVTLDAYGPDQHFDATVLEIDPAETVKEGVSTYRVRLQFAGADVRIKSGMTANLDIRTDERTDVIAVPSRAVTRHDDKKYVRILKDQNQIEEREVTTGLVGSEGLVEIMGQVQPGENVILYESTP